MIQDLGKRVEAKIEKMQEMFTKDLEELKNKQIEMNDTLEGIHSRIIEAEEQMNDVVDRMVEIPVTEQNIEKSMKRNEDSLRNLWENIKCTNVCIIGAPEGQEREKGPQKTFEKIIAENFPNMEKEIVNQIQGAQRVPSRRNPRRNTLRHIVIRLMKIKDRDKIVKGTREK